MPSQPKSGKRRRTIDSYEPGELPALRKTGIVPLAILVSDIHLSHKPPLFRSCEDNWYGTMRRYLEQLNALQSKYDCEVICAGDIFDKWNPPPETINFALAYLPRMYAIPGQHDLPHHSLEDIRRSAFWTLVEAGKINYLGPDCPMIELGQMRLHGFPWGVQVKSLEKPHDMLLEIAVVHQYVWRGKHGYRGAKEEDRATSYATVLKGYDVAVFGDNHIAFDTNLKRGCRLWNCGGFMVRKSDERWYSPSVGILYSDGNIERHLLDCSQDKLLKLEQYEELMSNIGVESFIEELQALGSSAINFSDTIKRLLEREKVSPTVKKIILSAMENK